MQVKTKKWDYREYKITGNQKFPFIKELWTKQNAIARPAFNANAERNLTCVNLFLLVTKQ